nr:rhomboid family intramembrane serine protease [candidate division Zixibacteria bacterium]
MRPYNAQFGGPGSLRIGPGTISPVIKYLLIINTALFVIEYLFRVDLSGVFGLVPSRFFPDFPNTIYQPLTYMFLHANFIHLFFNMFVLWMFGTEIERTWGSKSFLKFYIYCGLGGALLSLIFQSGGGGYSNVSGIPVPIRIIGASGAIYGVLTAYWLMFPRRILLLFFFLPMQVKWAIPLLFVLNFLAAGPNVAHLAHLGGALVGFAYLKLDWRLHRPIHWLRNIKNRRKEARLNKNRKEAEEIMSRVDRILDKINEVGIENISREDRKFLEDASQILSKKDK